MYRNIDVDTWTDPWIVEQLEDPHAKFLFVYLATCKHMKQDGAGDLTPRTISFETGIPIDEVRALLPTLAPKVRWWPEQRIIWVVNHFEYNWNRRQPNYRVSARNAASARFPELRDAIFERYPIMLEVGIPAKAQGEREIPDEEDVRPLKAIESPLKEDSKAFKSPLKALPKGITDTATVSATATAQLQHKGEVVAIASESATTKAPREFYSEPFSRWWAVYPRKDDKGAAFKAWQNLGLDGAVDAVIAGMMPYLDCAQWRKENGQYIPLGGTFLNRRQWEGSPVVTLPPSNAKPTLAY